MTSNDSRRRKIVYITCFLVSGWSVDLDRTISPSLTVIKEHHRSVVRPQLDRIKEQFFRQFDRVGPNKITDPNCSLVWHIYYSLF